MCFFSPDVLNVRDKHRGIRSQNTQPQRNKFMAAVVLKASSGKSGVSLFDDEPMSVWVPSIPQTCELWGVGMFWICCVKKRTWRAKRGSCLSCLMSLQLKECKIRMNQVTATATKEQTSAHNSDISSIVSRCCHERSTRICDVSCMMFCSMIGFRFSFIGGSTSHSSKGCSAGGEHCFDWHQTQRAEIPPVKARQIWHDFDTYFELAKMFEASIGILICCGWLWMLLNIAVYATFVTQMLCYRAARTWALPRPCLMMSRCDGKIGLSENVELIFGLCVLVRDTWKNIM